MDIMRARFLRQIKRFETEIRRNEKWSKKRIREGKIMGWNLDANGIQVKCRWQLTEAHKYNQGTWYD